MYSDNFHGRLHTHVYEFMLDYKNVGFIFILITRQSSLNLPVSRTEFYSNRNGSSIYPRPPYNERITRRNPTGDDISSENDWKRAGKKGANRIKKMNGDGG